MNTKDLHDLVGGIIAIVVMFALVWATSGGFQGPDKSRKDKSKW